MLPDDLVVVVVIVVFAGDGAAGLAGTGAFADPPGAVGGGCCALRLIVKVSEAKKLKTLLRLVLNETPRIGPSLLLLRGFR